MNIDDSLPRVYQLRLASSFPTRSPPIKSLSAFTFRTILLLKVFYDSLTVKFIAASFLYHSGITAQFPQVFHVAGHIFS